MTKKTKQKYIKKILNAWALAIKLDPNPLTSKTPRLDLFLWAFGLIKAPTDIKKSLKNGKRPKEVYLQPHELIDTTPIYADNFDDYKHKFIGK